MTTPVPPPATLVALCTYNERANLPPLVSAIREQLPTADVLVVDDNSPDGTGQWCDEFASQHPWFSVLHRPGKQGLGSAAWLALQTAVERDYQYVITIDADWSHPPEALPALLAAAPDNDVVVGSRYCSGGKVEGWSRRRHAVSLVTNALTHLALGLSVKDCSTAYRLYRVEALDRIDWSKLTASGYAYLEELLWALARRGARFQEVPITFAERRAGASKVNLSEAAGKLKTLVRLGAARWFGR